MLALWLAGMTAAYPVFSQAPASRTWTDVQNRKVEAAYGGMHGDSVLLKLPDGKTIPFPMERLSAEDQAFVKTQTSGAPAATPPGPPAASEPPRTPIEKRIWPQTVEVPSRSIEIKMVTESAAERKYVYQSEGFEFSSQAKIAGSVMKEVARTFEATRSLVNALPWGIYCQPPPGTARFQAALFESREDYVEAGGPPNSGGVYSTGDKVFKIPFQSLGLEKRGQTYFKSDFTSDTLIHEITHQMMDNYLAFLPMWIIEGTAEYTEMLPYKAGVFRADAHKSGLKDSFESWNGSVDLDGLERHFTMTRDQWQQAAGTSSGMATLYHRSQLLVYYFCHLDGDKKGTRFMKYLDAVHGEVAALRAFFADPRVEQLGGGRFRYPSDLKPPDMGDSTAPFKHLRILLDERSYEKLAAEIAEGYKSIGVKLMVR
ncbi:MAG TPA: SHD1 domain-containing protein [Prosthecobacter sp.]|nr:SHD1 domain-containing protein [Prosthecobacter sp.]